ncbi:MAG: radical SAM protein [Elusimicrobia bacterium]|nr:radical SAM protein [Elusimicrobiota bacterium]
MSGGDRPTDAPSVLLVDMGFGCNHRCGFCLTGPARLDRSDWLPFDVLRGELAFHRRLGARLLSFTGTSEPLLYPRLAECLAEARRLGYEQVEVITNGSLLSRARVDGLVAAGVTRFGVSIHSHDAAVEDALTGARGALKAKLQGLRRLLAHPGLDHGRGAVFLTQVLLARNCRSLAGYLAFFRAFGVRSVQSCFVWPRNRARRAVPSYRQVMPHVVKAMLLNEDKLGMDLTFGDIPPCMMRHGGAGLGREARERLAARYLGAGAGGSVVVSTGGLRFSWSGLKRQVLKRRGPDCAFCRHGESCDGVWRTYAALHGLGEMAPVRERGTS